MPTFRVTDPNTGKTIRITGDSAPTEQELTQIFSSTSGNAPAPSTNLTDQQRATINQYANQTVNEPSRIMQTLASAQKFLKDSPTLSIIGGATGAGLGGIPGAAIGATVAERARQLLDPNKALGGGEAGQQLQQGNILRAVTGTNEDIKQAGTQGVLSAATDLALAGVGRAIGPLAKGTVSKAGRSKVFQEAFKIPRAVSAQIKWSKNADELVDLGIPGGTMDDFIRISNEVTGQDGVASTAVREALSSADNAKISLDPAFEALQKASENATNVDDRILRNSAAKIERILSRSQGDEILTTKPLEAFDAIQTLQGSGMELLNAAEKSLDANTKIAAKQQASLYLDAADALERQLVDEGNLGKAVINSVKTPERIAALKQISPKLADKFLQAKSIKDLRSLQRPFVALNQAAQATLDSSQSTFSQLGEALQSRSGGIPGISDVVNLAKSTINQPSIRTSAATAPERVVQSLRPESILGSLRSTVSPQGVPEALTRQAVIQSLLNSMRR